MGAESLVKNTPNDPESAQFVYPSPTVLDLNEKGFIEHLQSMNQLNQTPELKLVYIPTSTPN